MGHLTLDQRYKIEDCIFNDFTITETADHLGRDKSVISREIKRNSDSRNGKYKAHLAQSKAQSRIKNKPKKKYFIEPIEKEVKMLLERDLSPEQISGRLKSENKPYVSHERIYQYIWADKKAGGSLYKHLRNKGKRYRKRGSCKDSRGIITNRVDIDERPDIVDQKTRIGDLEIDLIIGAKHNQAILTINDRAMGILFMAKVLSKQVIEIEKKTVELLDDWKPFLHTITSDNGKEFANHQSIAEQLDINFYFAKPYHSWQRGANENLNGLIRQYFPKECDFSTISDQRIEDIQNILNNRPRKRLGYKSPNEFFAEKISHLDSVAFVT